MKSLPTTLLALSLLVAPNLARADFETEKRQSDLSAFNMNRGELRLGLFQEEYALLDAWAVGTYLAPWIVAPFLGNPLVNFYTKVELFDFVSPSGDRTALALSTRFFWADIRDVSLAGVENDRFSAIAFPTSLALSRVFSERVTLTLEGTFVPVGVLGDVASKKDTDFFGTAAQSNVQIAAIGEYRLNRHLALNLVVRVAPWVAPLRLASTLGIDGNTTADVQVELYQRERSRPLLVQPGFTATWGSFWLQVGLGYGNLFLPGIRMVSAIEGFTPDFDAYFRF